jgi:hypothetical protein
MGNHVREVQLQITSADLVHLAGIDEIDEVLRQLLVLLGRDNLRTLPSSPQREEWGALAEYQRRLMIRIWAWSETQQYQ